MGQRRRPDRPASPLSWLERFVYLIVTVASVIYICFSVYRDSIKYDGILNLYDFAPGWGWLGREQDISNFEWHFWFFKFMAISPWYVGHIALGKIMEHHSLTSKKFVFLVYGLLALLKLVGWQTVGLCITHSTVMYLISQTGLSALVWISSLVLLSTLNFEPCITFMKGLLEDDEDETRYYLLMFTLALSNIRATSFCLEACWDRNDGGGGGVGGAGHETQETKCPVENLYHEISKDSEHEGGKTDESKSQSSVGASESRSASVPEANLCQPITYSYTDMVFFVMYLPLFFTGPILTYDLFKIQINNSQSSTNKPRVAYLSLHLVRFLFWALFNEAILHFLYFNAIQNSLRVLEQVPLFTLAGLGFCHGQFFMLKYHVMFGYPGTVAKFDGLKPPDGPKCISYIYLYSDMWKYFDRGLYSFLKRYIYIPCGGSQDGFHRQVTGSLLCFMYIFYWHGAEYYILLFIILNYAGVSMEKIGSLLCRIPIFKHLETSVLSVAMVQRVHAFFSIPIFLMSCFSVFCFFGGKEVGYLFFSRLILNGWWGSWTVLVVLVYCAIQNAIETARWLERRESHAKTS